MTALASAFDWPVCHAAEALIRSWIEDFCRQHPPAAHLAQRMADASATDLFEWVDHLVVPLDARPLLEEAGFQPDLVPAPPGLQPWYHSKASLPRVLLDAVTPAGFGPRLLALRPERLDDFIRVHCLLSPVLGKPGQALRSVVVAEHNGRTLAALERWDDRGFDVPASAAHDPADIEAVRALWRDRARPAELPSLFSHLHCLWTKAETRVGPHLAALLFFEAERHFWQSRNSAARLQKQRQDSLGLGWGNHDHHTYRCSRGAFRDTIRFFLTLGLLKRERFFAGAEAGWGAQVLEHPAIGIVVFADVDLLPEETELDFSEQALPPAPRLGTVGLWTALHGESLGPAGMHHLEARFNFDLLRDQLAAEGVATMKPFSNFPFLKQAFTAGERWPVPQSKLDQLLAAGHISAAQAETFTRDGALGSHLENLQRHGGYKGFNQRSVSAIIAAVDPRRQSAA